MNAYLQILYKWTAIVRLVPLALFLVQYKGRWNAPVALMLRGFAVALLIQSATVIVFAFAGLTFTKAVATLTFVANIALTVVAYSIYGIFLYYRWRS